MFTETAHAAGGEKRGQTQLPLTLSVHAQEQWAERTPAEVSLKTACERGVAVEAPDADATSTLLYPPYDALLVIKHATVATVLHNDGRLKTPGLAECESCSKLMDPVEAETCPWCGEDSEKTTAPGRVTITRGDL